MILADSVDGLRARDFDAVVVGPVSERDCECADTRVALVARGFSESGDGRPDSAGGDRFAVSPRAPTVEGVDESGEVVDLTVVW